MEIEVSGLKPYDGRYPFDFEFTTREWGWIKRLAGYLPPELDGDLVFSDPELALVLALVAMRRAGRVEAREVPLLFERFSDAPPEALIRLRADEIADEGDDADSPPQKSSNGSGTTSGRGSMTSSETSPPIPPSSGTTDSATSQSDPATLAT